MVSNHPPSRPEYANSTLHGIDHLSKQELRDLQETVAQRLLKIILPWAAVVAVVVLAVELVSELHAPRIIPAATLAALFSYLAAFPDHGKPLLRTWIVILTVYLSMAYLGWAVQSFRAPAVVGLAMILITWTCLFTPRNTALGIFALLLVSNGVIFALMRSGVYTEQPTAQPQLSLIILTGIYGALFISVLAPVRILFESVAASRKAERATLDALRLLQESRNFTIQAIDNSRQLFGWLSVDGTLQYANATALKMAGATSEEVLERSFWNTPWFAHDPIEQDRLRHAIARAARGETVRYELVHLATDGTRREIDLSVHPIFGVDGDISVLVAEGRDITDEREALRQKELFADQLHQSQKMELIGQLAGGVAHDFNNNLSAIIGMAELLRDGSESPQTRADYIEMILTAANRAGALTKKLLAISRNDESCVSNPIDVSMAIDDAVSMLRHTLDKRVRIAVEKRIDFGIVLGDDSMMQNAILNMGINAGHAMPDGGDLTIGLDAVKLDAEFCSRSAMTIRPGDYLVLSVRDSGVGMPAQVAARIFEPYFTTKEVGKGTGLGLAMVYSMVQGLEGTITVRSQVGQGTEFKLYLPRFGGA